MHSCIGLDGIVSVILLELGQLIGQFICNAARLTVLQPKQVQRDTLFLHFPVDSGILFSGFLAGCRKSISKGSYYPIYSRVMVAQTAFLGLTDKLDNGRPGAAVALCYLRFVASQAVSSKNMTTIGHNS